MKLRPEYTKYYAFGRGIWHSHTVQVYFRLWTWAARLEWRRK